MRGKLNSNPYAGKVIAVIVGLLVVIPAALYLVSLVLGQIAPIETLIVLSLFAGLTITAISLVLLLVEAIQDRRMDHHYRAQRETRLKLSNGRFECQYCGSQQIRESDRYCRICGKPLR